MWRNSILYLLAIYVFLCETVSYLCYFTLEHNLFRRFFNHFSVKTPTICMCLQCNDILYILRPWMPWTGKSAPKHFFPHRFLITRFSPKSIDNCALEVYQVVSICPAPRDRTDSIRQVASPASLPQSSPISCFTHLHFHLVWVIPWITWEDRNKDSLQGGIEHPGKVLSEH